MPVIEITEKHLDKAIAESDNNQILWNQHCILAQAAKEVFSDFVSCGYGSVNTKSLRFTAIESDYQKLSNIVYDFDHRLYDEVRKQLPSSFQLKRVI